MDQKFFKRFQKVADDLGLSYMMGRDMKVWPKPCTPKNAWNFGKALSLLNKFYEKEAIVKLNYETGEEYPRLVFSKDGVSMKKVEIKRGVEFNRWNYKTAEDRLRYVNGKQSELPEFQKALRHEIASVIGKIKVYPCSGYAKCTCGDNSTLVGDALIMLCNGQMNQWDATKWMVAECQGKKYYSRKTSYRRLAAGVIDIKSSYRELESEEEIDRLEDVMKTLKPENLQFVNLKTMDEWIKTGDKRAFNKFYDLALRKRIKKKGENH